MSRIVELTRFLPRSIKFLISNPTEAYRIESFGGEEKYTEMILNEIKCTDVFFDIGANVGLVTVHAASIAKTVVSFEPDNEFRQHLTFNIGLNSFNNIIVIPWAVSDTQGEVELFTDGAAGNSPSMREVGNRGRINVKTDTIDAALIRGNIPYPDVIKIDIEGAEILALKGMKNLLASSRAPRKIFVEIHPDFLVGFSSTMNEVINYLLIHGYKKTFEAGRDNQIHTVFEKAVPFPCNTIQEKGLTEISLQLLDKSNKNLSEFKNKHKGQRCVIIGNGPSLNKMDLSFLENEITFGMNRIFLMYDKWKFRPTYYVSVNPLVIEQSAEEILKIDAPKFLSHNGIPFFDKPGDINFLKSIQDWFFSKDPRNGICEGWTVTFVAMQLAYFMGFDEVVLIGVDHHFVTQGDPNREVVSEGDDPNHFHPGYFGKGTRWHLPDLERSEGSYRMAKQAFEAEGRRILDATVDGKLTIFPKVDYRELFRENLALPAANGNPSQTEAQRGGQYLVSAVVSTYNAEKLIRGCLQGLVDQTLHGTGRLEIIVVDSGSTQNEGSIVEEFRQRSPHIKYIRTRERETIYRAWNRGIKAAGGMYITNANTDDRLKDDAYEIMAEALDANPRTALVYGDVYVTDCADQTFASHIRCGYHKRPDYAPEIMLSGCHMGPQPMWRKSLHDELGYFDESLTSAADYEFWCRIAGKHEMLHIPRFLGLYHENPAGICNSNLEQSMRETGMVKERYRVSFPTPPRCFTNNAHYSGDGFVNICIVTYNRLDFTRQCITALSETADYPHVITVVDNNSQDGTREYLQELHRNGVIKNLVLLDENVGVAKASNLAWSLEPDAGHFLKLDNDIVMQKHGWLSAMTRTMEAFPQIGALAYNFESVSYPARSVNGFTVRVKETGNLGGACILIPKQTEKVLGCWCEEYGLYGEEDADYGHRIHLAGLLNVYMEDENIGFHLPAGKAARIDHLTWQAADGREEVESAEYRSWKDAQRKNNVESGLFPRNLVDYETGAKPLFMESSFVKKFREGSKTATICSIIIPVYNKVEFTKQCLEALKLTIDRDPAYEVIVVDNASSDGTAEYLNGQTGAVKIIRNNINLGFAKACNRGAEIARGKYLVFLNNDTVPHEGWLEALLKGAEDDKADICGARLLYPDGRTQHAGVAFESNGIGYHIFKFFPADAPAVNRKRFMQCVTGACMLISKSVFDALGGFDEAFINGFEDVDLCLRAVAAGKRILYVPESTLVHFEETSEGRKNHDQRNMALYLSRWQGKVVSDDDIFYREEGFSKERAANGDIMIVPYNSGQASDSDTPRPETLSVQELGLLCDRFKSNPEDRENTVRLILGLKSAGYHDDADRISSIHLRRHPGDSRMIGMQANSL